MANSRKTVCLLGCWVVLGVAAFAGCGAEVASGGTDSNTHWLDQCSNDTECGDLKCYCGLCTAACAGDEACSALGSNATCEGRPFGCQVAAGVCVASCETSMDCPAGLRCEAGLCTSQASAGKDAGVGKPPPPQEGGAKPPPQEGGGAYEPCAAMDARSSGARCAERVGFTWDGDSCEPVECSCAGTDCDRLYPTAGDCYIARGSCTEGPPELCALPLESGPCDGAATRYGYSPEAGACVEFIWGLCEGNDNNFATIEKCNAACAGRADLCRMCPNGDCSSSTDPPPSCASCPKSRSSNGDPCTVNDLQCSFLPCATLCLCRENGSGEFVWQCIDSLC